MNDFIEMYKDSRSIGNHNIDKNTDFAVTARTISKHGTIEDLQELTDYYEAERSQGTSYERHMKESGHRERDFYE